MANEELDALIHIDTFSYYRIAFAVVSKSAIFEKRKEELCRLLNQKGFHALPYKDIDQIKKEDGYITCAVVFQPMQFRIPDDKSMIWIAIQTEQLYSPMTGGELFGRTHLKELLPYLKKYDFVIDFCDENIRVLRKYGIEKINKCSVGYNGSILDAPEDKSDAAYDLLFIGNMPGVDSRRQSIVEYLNRRYQVSPTRFDLWGQNKIDAIRNARICLNLHFEEARYFESGRFDDYFSHGAFVMSEPIYDSFPYTDGEDYVSFYLTDMCEKIDYYLAHPKERLVIAQHAQQKMLRYRLESNPCLKTILDIAILESYRRYFEATHSKNFFSEFKSGTKDFLLEKTPTLLNGYMKLKKRILHKNDEEKS